MYNHKQIENKWQKVWEESKTYKVENDFTKPKYYCLDMFPYPSGAGLHVGHPEWMTANDIVARYKTAKGFNVLHPMGWDAFGLPAENFAIKTWTHPRITTDANISNFRNQIKALGFSYDWEREIDTTDPDYYKWTQWIFLKLFEKGLAYEQDLPINYCPSCKTGLANEEVLNDFTCERCGTKVEKKRIRQWVLAITKYADRLLKDVDRLDWPEGIKDMQRNWIGKSEGCEFTLKKVGDESKSIGVYTTRVDTVFGMTYAVLAPDHKDVMDFVTEEQKQACLDYIDESNKKSDQDRTQDDKEKTGVFTGSSVINPFSWESVPLWIGDYVLGNYGTWAVMAVPAHDTRDFAFAKKYDLPIERVLFTDQENERFDELSNELEHLEKQGKDISEHEKELQAMVNAPQVAMTTDGILFAVSATDPKLAELIDHSSKEARKILAEYAEEKWFGSKKVNFKLRDWLFSRQRYWGEPIPLVHCDDCGTVAEKEENLPILLPDTDNFEPSGDGTSPLSSIESFVNCECPKCGKPAKRETNTMPQWGGSCWYYLRYMDPKNSDQLVDPEVVKYWGEVDSYVGWAEHAVLHLLYARFWHKFLYDINVVPTDEPFYRLRNQGLILAHAFQRKNGGLLANDLVEEKDGKYFEIETGEEVERIVSKMSKSLKNVVNPDDIVEEYGADSLRLYEMYMAEFKDAAPWDTKGIVWVRRFLDKSERLFTDEAKISTETDENTEKLLHKTIKKIEEDIENYKFNTAIASMMILVNNGLPQSESMQAEWKSIFVRILHPFAPHLAEELNERNGSDTSVFKQAWPEFDESKTVDNTIVIGVQVLGKLRGEIEIAKDEDKDSVLEKAKANENVAKWLEGKTVVKEIYVPGKIVNLVVK